MQGRAEKGIFLTTGRFTKDAQAEAVRIPDKNQNIDRRIFRGQVMVKQDIRWVQRYRHFIQAFEQLRSAVELAEQRDLSELEEQGMIQAFEYTHELAWNTLKDFLEHQGLHQLYGSKDSSREAFKKGLIENGEVWMDMIKSRNLSPHTYNKDIAREIACEIKNSYCHEFEELANTLAPLVTQAES